MEKQVSYSIANFAAKFCNELEKNKTTICSPLSAEIVLALLALGCKNQSHAELLQALGIPDDDALRSSFAFLTSSLNSVKGATLKVANKVYVTKDGELKPRIKKDAKEVFHSSLEQLDFNENKAAAEVINNWVAQQTNNMIKDIVTPDMFQDKDTAMVLVNAIYFQGSWQKPFNSARTINSPFHLNNNTTITVPQMCKSETYFNFGVSHDLKAKLLEMKYEGGEASMVIVLPDEIEGLNSVVQKLSKGHNIMADIETLTSTELDVMIPKFKVETTIDLKELLPKLGIKSIFNEATSEIDMLISERRLVVSDAIQKAVIVVDEKGTEAAASTIPRMRMCCACRTPRFDANRPFLYLLIGRQIPLFIGVYEGSAYAQSCAQY